MLARLLSLRAADRVLEPLTEDELLIPADKVWLGVEVLQGSLDGEAVKAGLLLLPTEVVPVM